MKLCWGCKQVRPIATTDDLGRAMCARCNDVAGTQGMAAGLAYLAVTVPYEVGDRVDCRLAGTRYEGRGTVDKVSMDPREGGTVINPIFHVDYDPGAPSGKTSGWHCELDLTKVS